MCLLLFCDYLYLFEYVIVCLSVPPEFVVLANSTVVENQQHSITCLAMGDPSPSISWTFNGQVVPSQQGLLTFTPVLRSNAGVYTCTASNSAGTISSQITLNVLCKVQLQCTIKVTIATENFRAALLLYYHTLRSDMELSKIFSSQLV